MYLAIIALPSGIITAGYLDELRSRNKMKKNEFGNKII